MEEFVKFIEKCKKEKDFNEITAYCFCYAALKDYIEKEPVIKHYEFYPMSLLGFNISLNYITDNDLKNSMIKFLNHQNQQNAQEVMQKLYNSARSNTIKEFVEIMSKNKIF